MTIHYKKQQIWRRGELMAEMFLESLEPQFVAKSTSSNLVFDFFIGFLNPNGGINTFAVEVKATERSIQGTYLLPAKIYKILSNSNIPVLLLVVDVKENEFYYSWLSDKPEVSRLKNDVRVSVSKVDNESKSKLVHRMTA